MESISSSTSTALSSSSKGKIPLVHPKDTKPQPPRYSTIHPKLPLPIIPTISSPPPPPPKDYPPSPLKPEFIAYPTFTSRKMHVSWPVFGVLLVLLFLESTVIFVYTVIGLVKNTPQLYLQTPMQPQFPMCQTIVQAGPSPKDGLNVLDGAVLEEQISTTTIETTVLSTVYEVQTITSTPPATFTPPNQPHIQPILVTPSQDISMSKNLVLPGTSTTTLNVQPVETRIVYITSTDPTSPDPPRSTVYITTVIPASAASIPTTKTEQISTPRRASSTQTVEASTLTTTPLPASAAPTTQATAITTTPEDNAAVTKVVFSTTFLEGAGHMSPRSTVYVTTVVPGRT